MRDAFHEQLDRVNSRLIEMAGLVKTAMHDATAALLEADARLAEKVIAGDSEIDRLKELVEEQTFEQLARQQPVASDLRVLIAALRMVGDLERMGDLAQHVAKVARMRHPDSAVPELFRDNIAQMGEVAEQMVDRISETIRSRDLEGAADLMAVEDEMDQLRRTQFRRLLAPDYAAGIEVAIDIALLGRYYERFADHAVSVARRVVYLVTGATPAKP